MKRNELIEYTSLIVEKIADIDDIIDQLMEPLADYTDTVGELIEPIKGILAIRSFAKRMRFKSFLINYSREFETFDESTIMKLQKYLHDKKNLEFISDTIDYSISTRSQISSAILGSFSGKILSQCKIITYNDYAIINALRQIIDDDLIYFVEMCNVAFNDEEHQFHQFLLSDRDYFTKDQEEKYSHTADKLTSLQIFGMPFSGPFISGGGNTIRITELTRQFYDIVKPFVDSIK